MSAAASAPELAPMRCVHAVVTRVRTISPGFLRVTFSHPDFDLMGDGGPYLDTRIKLVFGAAPAHFLPCGEIAGTQWYSTWRQQDAALRGVLRTFSIVGARPSEVCAEGAEIDVEFALHGSDPDAENLGPAAQWALQAAVGQVLPVLGPNRPFWEALGTPNHGVEFAAGAAQRIVLIADATALPAVESILRDAHRVCAPGARLEVLAEVPEAADQRSLICPLPASITWVSPAPGAQGERTCGQGLVDALNGSVGQKLSAFALGASEERIGLHAATASGASGEPEPAQEDDEEALLWETGTPPAAGDEGTGAYIWVAGEQAAVKAIRRFFVTEQGLPRSQVAFMGYWRYGTAQAS